jgi:general secretion pathway protein J
MDEPAPTDPGGRGARAAGFTLVEMLVSLALLSLISVLLFQAIGAAGVLSGLGGRVSADTDLDIVRDHLRSSLARLAGRDTDGRRPPFVGEPERFAGTVLADRRTERGGAVRQTVWAVRRGDGTVDLVEARSLGSEAGTRPPEVLVSRAANVRLRYFGAGLAAPQPGWFLAWTRRDRLPSLIEISLDFPPGDRRRWPPLLVPLGFGQ